MEAFPRRWLVPGCAGGKGSPDKAQTLQCSHKPLSRLGWQHRQKHQDPRAGGASFPTEMCKHSRSYDILFSPHDSSEGNQPGCHSRGSLAFFFSPWKFESTTLSPITRHFRERKKWSQKGKGNPLAGRPGSRIWNANPHQSRAWSRLRPDSFPQSRRRIPEQAVAHWGNRPRRGGPLGTWLHRRTN